MKIISMSELRKNIYAATRELPVEVQAKGKTLFYITESMFDEGKPAQPIQPILNQEQQIRLTVKMVLEELGTKAINNPTQLNPTYTGTMPVENTIAEELQGVTSVHMNKEAKWINPAPTGTSPVDKTKTIIGTRYEVTATTLPMWCQGHFEQGVTHTCYKISYEDENGVEVLKDKWFCEKCVRGYMNRVGKVYGHLE